MPTRIKGKNAVKHVERGVRVNSLSAMRGSSRANFSLVFPHMYCREPSVMKDVITQSSMGEGRETEHLMQGCSKRLIGRLRA